MPLLQTNFVNTESLIHILPSVSVAFIVGFTVIFLVNKLRIKLSTASSQLQQRINYADELQNSPTDDQTAESEFSKCTSPGCIRCRNYSKVFSNLHQKMDDYLNRTLNKDEPRLNRLKLSVKNAGQSLSVKTLSHSQDEDEKPDSDLNLQHPTVFDLCGLPANPWYKINDMCEQDILLLEEAFGTIWEEFTVVYESFLEGNIEGWLSNTVPTGQWSVFHLYNQGVNVNSNCVKCPETARTLAKLQTFMSDIAFGNASFSVLQAGTHITGHYGPCNFRVRCHLGLQIPPHCILTVAHQTRSWVEERCLLFDDSYLHEVKHEGSEADGPRIVFMVDLWNPHVLEEEKKALKSLFAV